ncbi:packaged DNA stabilization gp4 family protein [Psychrobacter pygoscelis]|uniref:packaged DNA stabilization gp4 family protein n=1 Tax=Psychrobacter pygoscelis TaxID=2488563 RepID=UPI00103B8A73|nr:packaged DNA stabilization gp4 family protein [Psychrobacter pygoscelis]
MITKRDIVDRAFKLLAMSGYELDDSPEDEQDIVQTLDDLMAEIQTDNCHFGYIVSDMVDSYLGDEAGIKRDAVSGIAHKLALRICSLYGKVPPPLLVNQADDAYNALLTRYQKIPDAVSATKTWQFGSGNKVRWW